MSIRSNAIASTPPAPNAGSASFDANIEMLLLQLSFRNPINHWQPSKPQELLHFRILVEFMRSLRLRRKYRAIRVNLREILYLCWRMMTTCVGLREHFNEPTELMMV